MYYTYGQGEDGLYDYYQAKDGSGNLLYPAGYYDDPRTLTEGEQKAWASNIGVSGIGLSEGESMLGLFARRLEFNNSPMMMAKIFLNGRMVDWNDATFRTGFNQDYNASISGATERVNYYFSLGYINNEGAVQGNEYNAFRSNMKINAKITDYNTKVDAAQAAANTSKTQIANAISALQVQLNATTDESVRDQISTAITALQNAQTAADGLNNVQKASAITVSVPTFDLSAITSGAATLQTNLKTFKETAAALQQQLPEMQKKLDAIAAAKDSLPSDSISQLTASVTQLNQGMQGLNTGLGTLSGGLGQLNTSVQAQFPTAIQGITELNGGFMQLGSYNTSLLSGAEKLKGSSSTLAAGAGTLQSGTNQLASGLNTLGSQMSAGAAETFQPTAMHFVKELPHFQKEQRSWQMVWISSMKEGTSKLKSTVEDEFGDVLDRLKALTSDDCTYNTFSGKDSKMDGSVKNL